MYEETTPRTPASEIVGADEKFIRRQADEGTHQRNRQLKSYSQGRYHNATVVEEMVKPKAMARGKVNAPTSRTNLLPESTSCEERRLKSF